MKITVYDEIMALECATLRGHQIETFTAPLTGYFSPLDLFEWNSPGSIANVLGLLWYVLYLSRDVDIQYGKGQNTFQTFKE